MGLRLAILVSGNGSSLQYIIDAIEQRKLNAAVVQVIADRKCFALERAEKHRIAHTAIKRGVRLSNEIDALLHNQAIDFIVLAGFLSILESTFCTKWKNKIINIHPSLLPKYGGIGMWGDYVHRAVLENKEKESGCTVHFVTEEVDKGDIIVQEKCAIEPNTSLETLRAKVQHLEKDALLKALVYLAEFTQK